MAQFDYPRINFHGKASTNVGTANNNDFMASMGPAGQVNPGIMLNDIIEVHAFIPPRLYVSPLTQQALGDQYTFVKVMVGDYPIYYVAIDTVNADNYYEWAKEPLGHSSVDESFVTLYKTAKDRYDGQWNEVPAAQQTTIYAKNLTPGEWNYNGGMEVTIEGADVQSIVTPPSDGSVNIFTPDDSTGCPEALVPYLKTKFSNCNLFNPLQATPMGSICDMNPSAPYSSQFFNDSLFLYDAANTAVMTGTPSKGMTRWINFNRVVNLPPSPMIASGAVYHAIPKEDMGQGWFQLEAAFQAGGATDKVLGAFVRYSFYEVYEARVPDYDTELKPTPEDKYPPNPALLTIIGSITPWYEGDMKTAPMGRLLNPSPGNPFDVTPQNAVLEMGGNPVKPNAIAPAMFNLDTGSGMLSVDMGNSLQENRLTPPPLQPSNKYKISTDPDLDISYELTNVGQWDIRVGTAQTDHVIASVNIDNSTYTIDDYIKTGGMLDLPVSLSEIVDPKDPATTAFSLWGNNYKGDYVALMQESEYYVASDENCTYFDQGASGDVGLNQGTSPWNIYLRVFQFGQPVAQSANLEMNMFAYALNPIFALSYDEAASQLNLPVYDGVQLTGFPTVDPMIYVNVFTPTTATPAPGNFSGATEFYINTRVLRDPAFTQYYNQDGSPNADTLTFQALYDEVFQSYYMMFPGMTQVQSLSYHNEANWKQPWLAGALKQRVDLSNWMKTSYMPRSRTISSAQRKLIQSWVDLQLKS